MRNTAPTPSSALRAGILIGLVWCRSAEIVAAQLQLQAVVAWTAYLSATQARIARELGAPTGFLGIDFDRDAAAERRAVLGGAIAVQRIDALDARGQTIATPLAQIHHWRGDVLIRGTTVARLMEGLERGVMPAQEDVLRARVLERGPHRLTVYLRLQRKTLVTAVYDTEHVVTFARHGASRASSMSTATKIAEVAAANTPEEHELPPGDDRGFLWRLTAFWRYEDVDGGVMAECESLALSRDVPSLLRYVVDPLVERTARESLTRTLVALRAQFGEP